MIAQQEEAIVTCEYCGNVVEQQPGKRKRQFCSNSHKQLAYKKRHLGQLTTTQESADQEEQEEPDQTITLIHELQEAQARIAQLEQVIQSQGQRIEEQTLEISRLALRLDVERRFLQERQSNTSRGFKTFLKKQPKTPFIERMLAAQLFLPRGTWIHYRNKIRDILHATEDEMEEFTTLWKLLLLES